MTAVMPEPDGTKHNPPAPPRAASDRLPLWTVAELADLVARALSYDYTGAASGRVTDVPSVRVIRWYQTIGLVGRPAETRGRTALYGPRHLLQIVAVKRLQAEGHSLADIQARLLGAGDEVLAEVARVPQELLTAGTPVPAVEVVTPPPTPRAVVDAGAGHRRFWAQRPAAPEDSVVLDDGVPDVLDDSVPDDGVLRRAVPDDGDDTVSVPEPPPSARPVPPLAARPASAELSYGVPLAPGVTVLYTAARPPTPGQAAAIRAAAGPLLAAVSAARTDPLSPDPVHSSADPTTDDPAATGLTEGASA